MDYALNFAILESFYGESLKKDTNNKKSPACYSDGVFSTVTNSNTDCIQPVYKMDTEDRLGKDRLGKDKDILSTDVDARPRFDYQSVKKVVRFVRFAVI